MKNTGFHGSVYDFSVDYIAPADDDIRYSQVYGGK